MSAFTRFYREIKIASGTKIKVIRSDNGGEYRNTAMNNFCKEMFIKQEYTVPYNPEENGMAERMNRTLVEMTRCMLKDSGLDKSYCCALCICVYKGSYDKNYTENLSVENIVCCGSVG